MTDRRGDQGFAVVTQSVTGGRRGGRRRGPRLPHRLGVVVVLLAAVALVALGLIGPRLADRPNLDVSYFATPTPLRTPEPTYSPHAAAPMVTPLPDVTTADGSPLDGMIAIATDGFRYLDLATGTTQRIHDLAMWQDAVFMTGPGRYACICFVDDFDSAGAARRIDFVRIAAGDVRTTTLDRLRPSTASTADQQDPLFDVAVDPDHRTGLIAVATRTKADWRLDLRHVDIAGAALGKEHVLGRIALPPPPAGAVATPVPSDQPYQQNVYLDGPHIRLSPDGRTAVVWGVGNRYADNTEPSITQGAWRIRLSVDGAIEDVSAAPDLEVWPQYCGGLGFVGPDRLAALCSEQVSDTGRPGWSVRTFDGDARKTGAIRLPDSADYGYSEPLIDAANHRLYVWDPVALRIVRVDLDDGRVMSTTFDPAASSAAGVTSGAAPLPPAWHDADSAVQQNAFGTLVGSADGRRLFAIGMHPNQSSEMYSVTALGVFVVDPATLALDAHWSPAANDVWVATLPDGRLVTGGQPGLNAAGEQVPWEASLTIRDSADGRILARYGRVSPDQAPMLVGP